MTFQNSFDFAKKLDAEDPLNSFRDKFFIPELGGKQVIYFAGNSLGLEPRSVKTLIEQELNDWARLAVDGHTNAKNPWAFYHKQLIKATAAIVGAKPVEVTVMNSLTVNIHLLMVSFYRPTKKRFKIITEAGSFSSDIYVLESQVKFHGFDLKKAIIEVKPRKNEFTLRTEDILKTIKENADETALVFFGGVNYYTGQAFDMKSITTAAHKAGAKAGYDLAHGAGNILLKLHDWNVDFAAWCTYKYLNSGPGAVAGVFVHEKYAKAKDLPRFAGWWGHDEKERFLLKKGFKPMPGAEGWAQSNDPIFSMAAYKASVEIFEKAGMKNLVKKSQLLTGFLEFLIKEGCKADTKKASTYKIKIISPSNNSERGCQLSIFVEKNAKKLFEILRKENFVVDYREPNVIRIAPIPLYNTFEEVYLIGKFLGKRCSYDV
jgi:kynureninase